MSGASSDNGVVEIVVRLRGLTIAVSGPASEAAQFVSEITASRPTRESDSSTPRSFSLVEEGAPEQLSRRGEARAQIESSFVPCPGYLLDYAGRLAGTRDFAEKRIRRAFLAGQWAGAVLEGRSSSPIRSEHLSLRPRSYVVLRARGSTSPRVLQSSASYFRVVGSLQDSDSVSHSFPSETEARVYCAGAGVVFPQLEQ